MFLPLFNIANIFIKMKLWFIVLRVSVSHSLCQIMDLGTHCLRPPPFLRIFLEKFKHFFNSIKAFWSENFGLLGIKSVHGRPDSPSWYTNSRAYIVPPRVEPHCQLPSLLVHWSYRERNTHAMLYKCGGVPRLKHRKSGRQIIALTGGTDFYFR